MSDGLKNFLNEVKIIDTHEHIMVEKMVLHGQEDFFDLISVYVIDDLLAAGMTKEEQLKLFDKQLLIESRYEIFMKYYPFIKYGAYWSGVKRTMQELFGEKELSIESVLGITKSMKLMKTEGYYDKLMDEMNIEKMFGFTAYWKEILDLYNGQERLIPVPTMNDMFPTSLEKIKEIEHNLNKKILTFDELINAIDELCEYYTTIGVKALKFNSAYGRLLDYAPGNLVEANKIFTRILEGEQFEFHEIKALDDYLTEHIIKNAEKYNFVIVMHVGIHAWGRNYLERARANYLTDLVKRNQNVKFVLLHCGLPFYEEAIILSKYYSNVYLDLTWTHIIDRIYAKEAMDHILELAPINKVMAFGGDYLNIFNVKGHLEIAKNNLYDVLSSRIVNGLMTEEEAIEIAELWLNKNAKILYGV